MPKPYVVSFSEPKGRSRKNDLVYQHSKRRRRHGTLRPPRRYGPAGELHKRRGRPKRRKYRAPCTTSSSENAQQRKPS